MLYFDSTNQYIKFNGAVLLEYHVISIKRLERPEQ